MMPNSSIYARSKTILVLMSLCLALLGSRTAWGGYRVPVPGHITWEICGAGSVTGLEIPSEHKSNGVVYLTRWNGLDGAVTATVAVVGGSATQGTDYTVANFTVSWNDQEGGGRGIVFNPIDDLAVEDDESIRLQIVSVTGGATIDCAHTTAYIIDDDEKIYNPPINALNQYGDLDRIPGNNEINLWDAIVPSYTGAMTPPANPEDPGVANFHGEGIGTSTSYWIREKEYPSGNWTAHCRVDLRNDVPAYRVSDTDFIYPPSDPEKTLVNLSCGLKPWRSFKKNYAIDYPNELPDKDPQDIRLFSPEGDLYVSVDVKVNDLQVEYDVDGTVDNDSFARMAFGIIPRRKFPNGSNISTQYFYLTESSSSYCSSPNGVQVCYDYDDASNLILPDIEHEYITIGKAHDASFYGFFGSGAGPFYDLPDPYRDNGTDLGLLPWNTYRGIVNLRDNGPGTPLVSHMVDWEVKHDEARLGEWKHYVVNLSQSFHNGPGQFMPFEDEYIFDYLGCGIECGRGVFADFEVDNLYVSRGRPISKDVASKKFLCAYAAAADCLLPDSSLPFSSSRGSGVEYAIDDNDATYFCAPLPTSGQNAFLEVELKLPSRQWINAMRLLLENDSALEYMYLYAYDDTNNRYFSTPVWKLQNNNSAPSREFRFSPVETSRVKLVYWQGQSAGRMFPTPLKLRTWNLFYDSNPAKMRDLAAVYNRGSNGTFYNGNNQKPGGFLIDGDPGTSAQFQSIASPASPVYVDLDLGALRRFDCIRIVSPPGAGIVRQCKINIEDGNGGGGEVARVYANTSSDLVVPFSSTLARRVVIRIESFTTFPNLTNVYPTFSEIEIKRSGYDVYPYVDSFTVNSNCSITSNRPQPPGHPYPYYLITDRDEYTTGQISGVASSGNPIDIDLSFIDSYGQSLLREVDYFSFATNPSWGAVPKRYEILGYSWDPASSTWQWKTLCAVGLPSPSAAENRFAARGHELLRTQVSKLRMRIYDCGVPGSSAQEYPNFRWMHAYNHEVSFSDDKPASWVQSP